MRDFCFWHRQLFSHPARAQTASCCFENGPDGVFVRQRWQEAEVLAGPVFAHLLAHLDERPPPPYPTFFLSFCVRLPRLRALSLAFAVQAAASCTDEEVAGGYIGEAEFRFLLNQARR
eukprot:853803-Pleurochrysis_carterae.AAC.1